MPRSSLAHIIRSVLLREGASGDVIPVPASVEAWDRAHRRRATDAFFSGGHASVDGNAGFEDAQEAGGDLLQAHGMAKVGTLTQGLRDLLGMLSRGLSPDRGGGELFTAPLTVDREAARMMGGLMGTPSGAAYRDGPFILVARPGAYLVGDLSGLFGVLVNGAVSEEAFRDIKRAVQAVRPGLAVEFYRNAHRLVHAALGRQPPPERERHDAPVVPDEAGELAYHQGQQAERDRLDREHEMRWREENPGSDLPPPPREIISAV